MIMVSCARMKLYARVVLLQYRILLDRNSK